MSRGGSAAMAMPPASLQIAGFRFLPLTLLLRGRPTKAARTHPAPPHWRVSRSHARKSALLALHSHDMASLLAFQLPLHVITGLLLHLFPLSLPAVSNVLPCYPTILRTFPPQLPIPRTP